MINRYDRIDLRTSLSRILAILLLGKTDRGITSIFVRARAQGNNHFGIRIRETISTCPRFTVVFSLRTTLSFFPIELISIYPEWNSRLILVRKFLVLFE